LVYGLEVERLRPFDKLRVTRVDGQHLIETTDKWFAETNFRK
jgi:hypothetical protein